VGRAERVAEGRLGYLHRHTGQPHGHDGAALPRVALTVVVWAFGEMILFPSSSAQVADIAPAAQRGIYMGYYVLNRSAEPDSLCYSNDCAQE
jgi:dipeptide/tripeptide permease